MIYWDKDNWEINQNGKGRKIPAIVAVVCAPVLGGLFVMFLPLIGFVILGQFAWKALATAGAEVSEEVLAAMSPGLQPGVVAFTPSEHSEKEEAEKTS